jgi:hypothetical protein
MEKIKTKELLKLAMRNEDFSYDIYFRMAVIDEYLKGNEAIWELYSLMQHTRCSKNKNIPRNMIDHKEEFIELINNFKENGFDFNNPILVNKDGLIIDGAHRMACALYFKAPEVSITTKEECLEFKPNDYKKTWFEQNNLSECIPYAEKQKRLTRRRKDV